MVSKEPLIFHNEFDVVIISVPQISKTSFFSFVTVNGISMTPIILSAFEKKMLW